VNKGDPSDPRCFQIDALHAVSSGTSMSAPVVAGVVAVLLQKDPSLTQADVTALLQAGAHQFGFNRPNPRTGNEAPFADQSGPGEVDVLGSLEALDRRQSGKMTLPDPGSSWLTLSADYAAADGSTPITAFVELRVATVQNGDRLPTPPGIADGFGDGRLVLYANVDGRPLDLRPAPLARSAPGLWTTTIAIPPGLGGSMLTVGALFDGEDIVTPRSIPIGADVWISDYPPSVKGGCAVAPIAAPLRIPIPVLCSVFVFSVLVIARTSGRGSPGGTSRSRWGSRRCGAASAAVVGRRRCGGRALRDRARACRPGS
jgi:hypothetical protein